MSNCASTGGDLGVAVCLMGFVRTLARPQVYENIAAHFNGVTHARGGGGGGGSGVTHADIFGVVSSGGADSAKGQSKDVESTELSAALRALRPVAWLDSYDTSGPRCGLLCMRQFDRMLQCGKMVEARELQCNGRYSWVVRTRPDVTISGGGGKSLEGLGMRSDRNVVYKDRRAGDMVTYVPRRLWGNVSHVLANTPCDEVRRLGVDCTNPQAGVGGGSCKCNSWLAVGISRVLGLRLAYHSFAVRVVRTKTAESIINQAKRRYGGDGMRALHNRSHTVSDLSHLGRVV